MSMIPLAVPNLEGREAELLQQCIDSTFVSSVGPFVSSFEAAIAAESGSESAAVLCSGTVALQMALVGLGIGAGDMVMMPSLTFIATANAISHAGALPFLVDCDPEHWVLDAGLCQQLIEREFDQSPAGLRHRDTGRILRAIMPVMIMGASIDFDAIVALARRHDLRVVVDAAAAIGGRASGGRRLAETGVDAVCYSFNGNKTVTCGGGGAVAAADAEHIARIRHLSSTARVGRDYDHDQIGYNFRMTNVQAALGVAQMERLAAFLRRKAEIRDAYAAVADRHSHLHPFPSSRFGGDVHWFSGFWYDGDDTGLPAAFLEHMRAAGIDLRPFWKPIHLQAPYADCPRSDMKTCEHLWTRIFALPCSTHLSPGDVRRVTDAADDFWSSH